MRYIKEYMDSKYEDMVIVELSEYLQEFFDKFGISECIGNDMNLWRRRNYWKIYGETRLAGGYSKKILINVPNMLQKSEMEAHLRNIRKNIQNRLGYEVYYYFHKNQSIEIGYFPDRKLNKYGLSYDPIKNESMKYIKEYTSYDSKLDDEIHELVSKIRKMEEGVEKDAAKMEVVDLINKRKELRKQGIVPAFTTAPVVYRPRRKRTRDDLAGETPVFEKYEMQDLEDYLQEFFDKYNIEKTDANDGGDAPEFNNYYIDEDIKRYDFALEKIVVEVFTNNFKEIRKELIRILPNIEKRLGQEITYTFKNQDEYFEIVIH